MVRPIATTEIDAVREHLRAAVGIFLIVTEATFPVVLPIVFISDVSDVCWCRASSR